MPVTVPKRAEHSTLDRVDVAVVEDVWGPAFEALGQRFSVVLEPTAWDDPSTLSRLAGRARAIVVRNRTAVTRSLLEQAPRLQVVARAGVGTDNIDLSAADELGIVVVVATGANARSVAEHALCLALALARDICGHERRLSQGRWERPMGAQLRDRTWGVVGMGATGTAVGELVRSFGMKVVGYDPYLPAGANPIPGAQRVDNLMDLAASADVVSLHVPLTAESGGLIGRAFLSRMREGAYLINVARGELVDEEALADALETGRLAGAALDVRRHEPPGPSRLDHLDHVVLTPHVAGLTHEAQDAVITMLAEDLRRILNGSPATRPAGTLRFPRRK
ncbi:MAG TPA: hydroxyacid dehydrogenase [Acidimicrobiales bacterium]|nr:hydroxyacid dehydrogenase [Acidimicrobiales bacterium]